MIAGLVILALFGLMALSLTRLFRRTRHGLAWRLAPWVPLVGLAAWATVGFASVPGAPFMAETMIAAVFIWWFALIGLLAYKRWPADNYADVLAGEFE